MARVLLVDTNFSAWPILNVLEALGHTTYLAGGKRRDFLAKQHPCYRFADYANPEAFTILCEKLNVDYLVPGCNDLSYASCTTLYHLWPHKPATWQGFDSISSHGFIHDKAQFRKLCRSLGLSSPQIFNPNGTAPNVPVICKPVDAYSGKGISVLHKPTESTWHDAVVKARQHSRSGRVVCESYVAGQLYSISAFIKNQRIQSHVLVIEYGSVNPFAVDTSHMADDVCSALKKKLIDEMEALANHLQLNDGLIHGQFIAIDAAHQSDFVWVELTRRCPGDLYSQLIESSTELSYCQQYIASFLGLNHVLDTGQHIPETKHWMIRHTFSVPNTQLLSHIEFNQDVPLVRWVPIASTGDCLDPAPISRIGIGFFKFDSALEAKQFAKQLLARTIYDVK